MSVELVVFTTPVCSACVQMKPVLSKLSQLHDFDFEVVELSQATLQLFQRFAIKSAPTMMVIENGHPVNSLAGYYGEKVMYERLLQWGVIRVDN